MKPHKPPAGAAAPAESPRAPDDAATGLPWPTTWRGVYLTVIGFFITWLILLAALSKMFS